MYKMNFAILLSIILFGSLNTANASNCLDYQLKPKLIHLIEPTKCDIKRDKLLALISTKLQEDNSSKDEIKIEIKYEDKTY